MLSDMVRYIGPRSRGGHFNTSVLRRRVFWLNVGMDWEKQELHNVTFVFASQWLQIRSATPFGLVRTQPFTLFIFAASLQPCSRNDPKIVLQEESELTLSI